MKNIYESSFNKIEYSEKLKLLEINWLQKTESMTDSQYKSEFLTNLSISQNYNFNKLIVDERQFHFERSEEIQNWANNIINGKLLKKSNKIKMAIVYNQKSMQKIGIKKMMTQMELKDIEILYFESKEDAHDWLLKGEITPSDRRVLLFLNNVFTEFTNRSDDEKLLFHSK
ncbi:MAG: hypothetical protein CMO01_03515 [Thalassobius sp.]|nr:hypothetical protein [Thalassovita sp.]